MSGLRLRRAARTTDRRQRRAELQVRLVPISVALAATIVLAGAVAAGLITLILSALGPVDLAAIKPGTGEVLEIVKISLAVVAGIGGVVALVVAYRKQRVTEAGENREQAKLYTERFDKASDKLGDDAAAVRLAGVHALAALADDWAGGRQTCIDVLCAYLRMPYEVSPEPDASVEHRLLLRSMAEVRRTIWGLIGARLRLAAGPSWRGHDFDFTGAVIDCDVPFFGVRLSSGTLMFNGAQIVDGNVWFHDTEFSGCEVVLSNMELIGGELSFQGAKFSSGVIWLVGTQFRGGEVSFGADFCGAEVWFHGARFGGGKVWFDQARFLNGKAYFGAARFNGSEVTFEGARFDGGEVDLRAASGVDPASFGLPATAPGLLLPSREEVTPGADQQSP
ncbi:pentapeptide repeat-containing protein [Nonomuraea sp. NN258]|uniref:pentapeptide repeat-containing protein n=1 Tax=Nonomuraea antri TaxID=2730852 RepID=UPI00156A3868|nr:pentapeptide repeat-containing protein [Nonomuraea antri]NRQ33101.1 pentapeptide repeat-containing protein [Nonomuraea antri]